MSHTFGVLARRTHRRGMPALCCYKREMLAGLFSVILLLAWPQPTFAQCDELISRLLTKALAEPVKNAGCGPLSHLGLDQADHHLDSVCYSSSGALSTIQVTASLKCATSDHALIRGQTSEIVTASAEVQGSDCSVIHVDVSTRGEIGKILSSFLADKARGALAQALKGAC